MTNSKKIWIPTILIILVIFSVYYHKSETSFTTNIDVVDAFPTVRYNSIAGTLVKSKYYGVHFLQSPIKVVSAKEIKPTSFYMEKQLGTSDTLFKRKLEIEKHICKSTMIFIWGNGESKTIGKATDELWLNDLLLNEYSFDFEFTSKTKGVISNYTEAIEKGTIYAINSCLLDPNHLISKNKKRN